MPPRHPPRPTRPGPGSAGWDLSTYEVWVAEPATASWSGYALLGPRLARRPVRRARRARASGVGAALLDLVKALRPGRVLPVGLRVQRARPARSTAPRGLVELERTDGAANEEKAPDVRMAWPGSDPLAFFRGLIDEVDDELGELLARRAALTACGPGRTRAPRERDLGPRARDRRADGRCAPPSSARSGWPGSCTRSSPRASTPRASRRRESRAPRTVGGVRATHRDSGRVG